MKKCANCNNSVADSAKFCTQCGASFASAPQPEVNNAGSEQQNNYQQNSQPGGGQQYQQQQPFVSPYDHTHKFTSEDISGNKVFSMLCYLYGIIGIILAALVAQKSDFAMFHLRQACKFLAIEVLMVMVSMFLVWTFIVPIVCGIFYVVLFVIKIITVFQIASGKAKEPAIIRSFGFLR